MNSTLFIIFRNITILFATLMLVKYYVFLVLAPFHSYKETLRRIKLRKIRKNRDDLYRPLISVIIPTWNEEIGIIKTIESVVLNTYTNIEILVVNDGSSDNTDKIMKGFIEGYFSKKSPSELNIKYFKKKRGGKGTALNHGIAQAKGEIIVTIDADSVLEKHALERLAEYFEDRSIDAAIGQVKVAENRSLVGLLQQLEYTFGFYYKRAHSILGAEYIFGGACAAFRKEKTFDQIGLFNTVSKTEDIEMSLRSRYHGLHAVYAENVICFTEGASTIVGLINQRLRWKKGRFDTFIKYRQMFFSLDKRHNKPLSWFVLPYALLSELQLLFEPIGIALLAAYSIISGDYLSLSIGILFIFLIYLVVSIFNQDKLNLKIVCMFPFTWPLFYILVWVEYVVLVKSIGMILRGNDITWQKWARKGVNP